MRSREEKRRERLALVRAFEHANMTRVEYCQRHGITTSIFDYWRRRARSEDAEAVEASFFEIEVEDDEVRPTELPRQPDLEVELPLGVKLRFFGTTATK